MTNTNIKKNNAPYYITAFSATLLFAGVVVFAIAPYIGFLAPIAALGFAAQIIAAFAIPLTILAVALSYKAVSKNKAIAGQETQLAEKDRELEDKDVVISCVNKQLAERDVAIAEQETQLTEEVKKKDDVIASMKDQLAEKDRMFREEDDKFADSLFNDHNDDAKRELQKTRQDKFDRLVAKRKQEEASVLSNQSPIALAYKNAESEPDTHERTVNEMEAQSEPDAQSVGALKQTGSGRFIIKLVSNIGFVALAGLLASRANALFSPVSDHTSLANSSTDVVNVNNVFIPNSSSANPFNPQTTLDNKLDQVEKMLNLSHESAKKDFGVELKDNPCYTTGSNVPSGFVYNNRTTDYVTPPIQANGTVAQNMSIFSRVKDTFLSFFISNDITSNVEVVEESTQVGQNDPTQACTVIQARGNSNRTVLDFVPTPCAPGDYQVPLPGLQHVALCYPSMPRSAPPSGP